MNDIHSITLESTETGYTLTVESEEWVEAGSLNDIAVMRQLLVAARYVQSFVDSHDEALASWQTHNSQYDRRDAYNPLDPKHPSYFETFADIARTDDRLHQEGLK